MTCPRCQAENDAGARFCEDCGARLEAACPNCGTLVTPCKKFCRSCGVALNTQPVGHFASPGSYTPRHRAEKILTSKSALEGERKQVTVLFADLKGSIELLADRDPEEARKILDPVLELMMDAVHRYEGTVNQVMGDGIMALFGAPLDRPIVRAVPGERENRPGEAGVLRTAALSTGPLSRLCSNRVAGLRARAKAMSLDPNVWFENGELVAAQEIGEVTVMYVRNIYKYYVAYQLPRDQSQLL